MTNLETLTCSSCGAPLKEENLDKCPYCNSKNYIKKKVNLLDMTKDMASKYVDFFKNKKEENPTDNNALYAMGLLYLGMKNYTLAQRNFKESIDISPIEGDVYYYYALSLVAGRAPQNIEYEEAMSIEEFLNSAIALEEKRKYYMLLVVIRQGAFINRGLTFKGDHPDTLVNKLLNFMPEGDEMTELENHVVLTNEKVQKYIHRMTEGGEVADDETLVIPRLVKNTFGYMCPVCHQFNTLSYKGDVVGCSYCCTEYESSRFSSMQNSCVCYFPKEEEDSVFRGDVATFINLLEDEGLREHTLNLIYEPDVPQKEKKPFYKIWRNIKTVIWSVVLTVVMVFVCAIAGLNVDGGEFEFKDSPANEKEYAEYLEFKENNLIIAHKIKTDDGEFEIVKGKPEDDKAENIVAYDAIPLSLTAIAYILLQLLPLIIGIIIIIVDTVKVARKRREVASYNKRMKDNYVADLGFYKKRPTIMEYVSYCRYFLKGNTSHNEGYDPVTKALEENNISEEDLSGKIFFVNHFNHVDKNRHESTDPYDVLSRIYYVIAVPQKERVLLMKNYWDTRTNQVDTCDTETIFYRNMTAVTLKDAGIEIEMIGGGVKSIFLPPYRRNSILHYQNDNPARLDYSNTRTSSPVEFRDALEHLMMNYR